MATEPKKFDRVSVYPCANGYVVKFEEGWDARIGTFIAKTLDEVKGILKAHLK